MKQLLSPSFAPTDLLSIDDARNLEGKLLLHLRDGGNQRLALRRARRISFLCKTSKSVGHKWCVQQHTIGSLSMAGTLKAARVAILFGRLVRVEGKSSRDLYRAGEMP